MKHLIFIYQGFKSLNWVMDNYAAVFEDKPEVQSAKETFAGNNDRIGELITNLVRPRSIVYRPRQNSREKLRILLARMAGIGVIVATRQQNAPLADMFKVYKSQASRISSYKLYRNAMDVAAELTNVQALATDVGLTAALLAGFQQSVSEYGATLENTDQQLKLRKSNLQELKSLVVENTNLLKLQLDPFAEFIHETSPDFYRDYMIARRGPKNKKPAADGTDELTEMSGTVTDSITGLPVANAVLDVALLGISITSDEDGYYLFDEFPAGTHILACHATGYKLPENVTVTITDGESLSIDFSLIPEVEANTVAAA